MQVCLPLPPLRQVPPHLLSISPCLQSWVAHVGCCELLLPACLPACLPAFLPSFLPFCLPAFLPSFLPAFQASFLPSFLPSSRKREKNPKKITLPSFSYSLVSSSFLPCFSLSPILLPSFFPCFLLPSLNSSFLSLLPCVFPSFICVSSSTSNVT